MADLGLNLNRARAVVRRYLPPTPLVRSRALGLSLKLECLQQTGAYKVRGAVHALHRQTASGDVRTVVAASAGNHAAGVAWAARAVGVQAVAVVPHDAPASKVNRTRQLGARVVHAGATFAEAEQHARALAAKHQWRFLHAFDDPDIIAGQATVGIELVDHHPDVVLVPVGGGGLAAGICLAFANTPTRVIGVRVRADQRMTSVADGTRVAEPGRRTTTILDAHLDRWITVTDAQVRSAIRRLYRTEGWMAEGAGALAVAAASEVSANRIVAVVSGGNIDMTTFLDVVGSDRCHDCADRPGQEWSPPAVAVSERSEWRGVAGSLRRQTTVRMTHAASPQHPDSNRVCEPQPGRH